MMTESARHGASAALTEADRSFLRSLGERERASVARELPADAPQAAFQARYRDSLRTAAFLGEFDPAALMPGIDEAGLQRLLRDCTVSSNGIVTRWRLNASARGRLLGELIRGGETERFIAAAADFAARTAEPPDPFSQALVALCRGSVPDRHTLAGAGIETWSAYRAALVALKDAGLPDARSANALLANISHAEMMEPFRFLTGWKPTAPPPRYDANQVFGEDAFVGRRDKLALLRSFVDVLDSEGYYEAFARGVQRLRAARSRTLVLSGTGGVGKSTLVAKFILDHVEKEPDRLRFVYLDFDRATVNPAQPATLALEIARQLRWQSPELTEELDGMRERLRTEMRARAPGPEAASSAGNDEDLDDARGTARLPPELVSSYSLEKYLHEIAALLRPAQSSRPATVLLVLDTFEEVQTLGDEAVARVERMVESLGRSGSWHTLVVGRDEVAGFFEGARREVLEEFADQASRRAFVEARGVPPAESARVAKIAGGRPLALLLAARLVREQGISAIEVSLSQRLGSLFRERLIEGVLYQRILGHIADEDVRRIAHPGLVLRRIDADVIGSVIVPVLGLSGFDEKKIAQVMAAFRRQKDLVRVEPDGSVVHRSDVRVQMLELLSAEDPSMVSALHRAAVGYYAERQQRAASGEQRQGFRIEELYHRLRLGADLDIVVERWVPTARSALARALPEIADSRGRLALNILLGRLPPLDEAPDLPPLLAREFLVRTVKSGLAYHAPEKAVAALVRNPSSLERDFVEFYLPVALDRAGQWTEASRGYEALAVDGWRPRELLAAADFFERWAGPPGRHHADMRARVHAALSALPQRGADVELALARLRRRMSPGQLSSFLDLPRCAELLPIAGPATARTQWLVTLTADVDERGLGLFDGMPVTDAMRRQLNFLISLYERAYQSDYDPELVSIWRVLLESRQIGSRSNDGQARFAGPRPWQVLRHLMRPATPQWYVPLAATLRHSLGGSVDTGFFFDRVDLPRLPEPPPQQLRSTRALAELFAQLDQLGMLAPVLRAMSDTWPELWENPFSELMGAYVAWRADLFPTLDPWLERMLPIRRGLS